MITDIAKLDKNFTAGMGIDRDDVRFYDVRCGLFDIYGLYKPYENNGLFRRMPSDIAEKTSVNVSNLNYNTSGGSIRFKTDSDYVAIHMEFPGPDTGGVGNINAIGKSGLDIYNCTDGKPVYFRSFNPGPAHGKHFEAIVDFETREIRELLINLPLYDSCEQLLIGLRKGSTLANGAKYKHEKPIVYYGSSITQGGCASRPGNSYRSQGILIRIL